MDVCVTVPMRMWDEWIGEGDLPGEEWSGYESHFWIWNGRPRIEPGERVYIVAHGRLRGYAPLVKIEIGCRLAPHKDCLLRRDGAVAVTITQEIKGFRGWRYRWWEREDEAPFPEWRTEGVGK